MFTTKNVLRRLNSIIDTVRSTITNKEILDYILSNLELVANKGAAINIKEDRIILIVDSIGDNTFYLELSPSLECIDKVYTRLTKDNGNFDERFTISFDKDMISVHQLSSSINKDNSDMSRILGITDKFKDETYISNELRFRKRFSTNISYPLANNAESSSSLEEVYVNSDGSAAFKRVIVSSELGENHSYGLFDAKANEFTTNSNTDELSCVQLVTEDEYQSFLSKVDKKIMKELK